MSATAMISKSAERNRLYTLLGVGQRELQKTLPHFGEDDYRAVLTTYGAREIDGKPSASTMTIAQLEQTLEHLKQLGFKPKATRGASARRKGKQQWNWRDARIAKLNAMWCALADAGHVRDRSEHAMKAWCAHKVPELTRAEWSDSNALNKAIEMLKRYCERCGVELLPRGGKAN